MKQENKGKLAVYEGRKNGDDLVWSTDALGEKEYLYFGEAKEALENVSWAEAEHICNQTLNASHALLFKNFRKTEQNTWKKFDERVLLFFAEEEKSKL